MRILAIVQGEYGNRIVANIRRHLPAGWQVEIWTAPRVLPPVIDYPEEFLPETFAPADLLLSLGEHPGVAEFLPDIAKMCGARAVLAPIDNVAYLPPGLMNQLAGWLAEENVAVVFPKPFCSLTESTTAPTARVATYDVPEVSAFARVLWPTDLRDLTIDPIRKTIEDVTVARDAACGCGRHIASGLIGCSVDEAEEAAGLLHHHYPCLAAMVIDPDYDDTLMHVSGNLVRAEVALHIAPHKAAGPLFAATGPK